jgi:hypothetical protein
MTLTEFRAANQGRKISVDIEQRWQERVVRLGMRGAEGAERYLEAYGRGIASPKVILLASRAEMANDNDMAMAFWRKAYELAEGVPASAEGVSVPVSVSVPVPVPVPVPVSIPPRPAAPAVQSKASLPACFDGGGTLLPDHLQPGKLMTMQPTDGNHPREFYVNHLQYWGQPKRDGNRMVVFVLKTGLNTGLNTQAGGFGVFYQMRSLALHSAPNPEMHQCLLQYGNEYGGVILDGELWWEDVQGGEHRTAAQAQTANEDAGQPEVRPRWRYSIFTALYSDIAGDSTAGDLAAGDLTAKYAEVRILLGDTIGSRLAKRCSNFEVAPTAKTMSDKVLLAANQQAQGREGEVWYRVDAPYTGGKTNGSQEPIVRTKYTVELSVVVLNLTRTDKARPFGAIEVGVYHGEAIKPIGSVGTGFTQAQMVEIARRHQAANTTGQPLAIAITSRRFTEGWQVWHASFDGFSDRSPQACTFAQLTGAQITGAQITGKKE